jgi:hypothetical protein
VTKIFGWAPLLETSVNREYQKIWGLEEYMLLKPNKQQANKPLISSRSCTTLLEDVV